MYSNILLVSVLLLLVSAFLVFKKSFLSPTVELLMVYTIASVCLQLFVNNWKPAFTLQCSLTIISSLIVFGIGEFVAERTPIIFPKMWTSDRVFFSKIKLNGTLTYEEPSFFFPVYVLVMGLALQILAFVLRLKYIVSLLDFTGISGQYSQLLNNAYKCRYFYENVPEEPQISTLLFVFSECFALTCLFIFLSRKKKRLADIIYLIPIIPCLMDQMLLGGRSFLIKDAYAILFLFLFFHYKYKKKHLLQKAAIIGCSVIVVFCLFFKAYGLMRRSLRNVDIQYFLSYPATSLQALNCWLLNPTKANYFGEETFITQQGILNKLGGGSFQVADLPLPFVEWNSYSVNIYSAIRRYIHDFGYLGMYLIQLFIGFFYGYLKKITVYTNKIWMVMLYSQIGFAIITSLFEDQFFQLIVSATIVYEFVFLQLISLLVKDKKKSDK